MADGGLYAELVQNGSFEYSAADRPEWNALTGWELVRRGGRQDSVVVNNAQPLNTNNPNYAMLSVKNGADRRAEKIPQPLKPPTPPPMRG